jgi:uncharacterized protein YuzE
MASHSTRKCAGWPCYDPRYNIAYLRFHTKPAEVETLHLSDELNVDIAPDGTVYGIEMLTPTSS